MDPSYGVFKPEDIACCRLRARDFFFISVRSQFGSREINMSTEKTAAVVRHRLEAIRAGDIDAIMGYYTENSTIYTTDGPVKGLEAIRQLFLVFFAGPFAGVESLEILRQDCEGEFAYLYWKAKTAAIEIPCATDTIIIRDGKIVVQSCAAHFIPKTKTSVSN